MTLDSSVDLTYECWTCIPSPTTVNTLVIQNLVIGLIHRKDLYGMCSWSYVPKFYVQFCQNIVRHFEAIVRILSHQMGVKAIDIWQFIQKCTIYYFCKRVPSFELNFRSTRKGTNIKVKKNKIKKILIPPHLRGKILRNCVTWTFLN